MISIIIPVHNAKDYTNACIESIWANIDDYEIIIIDNASKSEFSPPKSDQWHWVAFTEVDKIKQWHRSDFEGYGNIKLIRNEENLGFPKAVNQGIEVSKGDVIAILNNDCIVTPHSFEILQSHLLNGLDMVGPVTNSISGPQQILIDPYEDLKSLYKAAEANKRKNEGQSYPYHRLVFFCVLIKREIIDKIGLLDEIYTPGNCEDDDFCMKSIEAGFKLGIAKDAYIHHFGSVTHKAMDINYRELLAKNQKIFNEKWADKYKELVKEHNG